MDAALDGMRGALTDDQFRAALGRFVVAMRNDPPAIFLVWPNRTQAVSRRFVLPPESAGTDASRSIAGWRLRGEDR